MAISVYDAAAHAAATSARHGHPPDLSQLYANISRSTSPEEHIGALFDFCEAAYASGSMYDLDLLHCHSVFACRSRLCPSVPYSMAQTQLVARRAVDLASTRNLQVNYDFLLSASCFLCA